MLKVGTLKQVLASLPDDANVIVRSEKGPNTDGTFVSSSYIAQTASINYGFRDPWSPALDDYADNLEILFNEHDMTIS